VPPRYAYWTILIDDKPTAFRAREREELQPTFVQLQRKNTNVTMRWFARGKLWESPEAERAAERRPAFTGEKRGADWRPGGAHKDPRDRFKKKHRPERATCLTTAAAQDLTSFGRRFIRRDWTAWWRDLPARWPIFYSWYRAGKPPLNRKARYDSLGWVRTLPLRLL
jgi:hypothetical protein